MQSDAMVQNLHKEKRKQLTITSRQLYNQNTESGGYKEVMNPLCRPCTEKQKEDSAVKLISSGSKKYTRVCCGRRRFCPLYEGSAR